MSTTVDNRVVEMRFDNKQFETNVATTMSTLDKLKQKLNFTGASKGIDSINAATKNVNMNGLANSVENVRMKFSALEVMGVTALANITNSAVNAGKRIVSALTIDPIKTGFQEYETQINAVQTILANTESKGTTLDDVNKALDTLNTYADKTIYNFTEMTRNIGTFTAAGIDLDTSVNAIQGIANLAAVSGSTSQQASTAMYQLSQALASGTVKLMDWNSVVNAGMGGQVFQDALKETARVHGVAIDSLIEKHGSFRETLSEGWITSEILTETLQKFTLATEGLTEAEIEANRQMLKAKGYTDEQIEGIFKLGNTATNAATKVKTFTQLWEVLKESAQSGWSQTWKLIVGDFEEARDLLTPLADTLTGFINKMSDWRNNILRGALDFATPWTSIVEKLEGAGLGKIQQVAEAVENVTDKLAYFQEVVDAVWRGDYFNSDTGRFELLDQAGYDHRVVQDLVNKGMGYQITIDDVRASHEKFGLTMEETSKSIEGTTEVMATLTDEQLKNAGLTEDEIDLYRALEKEAARLDTTVGDLAKEMSENNGRDKLINSFKNIGSVFMDTAAIAKDAFATIFDPPSTGELAVRLYGLIDAFETFTEKIRLTREVTTMNGDTITVFIDNGKKLIRIFNGVFAVLDIVTTILAGPLKLAFNVVKEALSAFDMDILDLAANLGDALVEFRDWLLETNSLATLFDDLIAKLPFAVSRIKDWFNVFKQTPAVQKLVDIIDAIKDAFNNFTSGEIDLAAFASSLGENLANALMSLPGIAMQVAQDFIAGFQNGISDSVSGVISDIITFCVNFVSAFAEALGVQSPSWKAYDTASDFFQGFINGASDMIDSVLAVLRGIGEKVIEVFRSLWDFITDENGSIEWGKLFAGGSIISGLWLLKQLATAFSGLANALGGIDDLLEGAGRVLKSFSKVLNGFAWDLKAKALLKMAISIGILVAAIWALTEMYDTEDPNKLWRAVGVIGALAGILIGLAVAMHFLSGASAKIDKGGISIDNIQSALLQIGIALLAVAGAVKVIDSVEDPKAALTTLAGIAVGLVMFLALMGGISRYSKNVSQIGGMMLKLAIAMMLMVGVCKLVSKLSDEEMAKGILFATAFAIFVRSITAVAKSAGNNVSKVGGMVLKLTIAMALMVGVCKLAAMLSVGEMLKGAAFAGAFILFVWGLVAVTKIGKKQQLAKLGGLILSISFSLLLLIGVCKLVGKLSVAEILKGAAFVAGFVFLLKTLVGILKIGNDQQMAKVAGTILAISVAIAILAGVAAILSFMPLDGLAKGIVAVGLLSTMMVFMIKALKGAQNVKGSLIVMTVAIGLMAGAVAALSFIPLQDLLGATAAMVLMMGAFALMIHSLKGLKKIPVGGLIVMVGVIAILAVVVYQLRDMDPLSALGSAGALSILLLAMAGVLGILSLIGGSAKKALWGVLALTALIIPLRLAVWVLKSMNGVDVSIGSVLALTGFIAALSVLVVLLTGLGIIVSAGWMFALAGLAAVVVLAAAIGAAIWAFDELGIGDNLVNMGADIAAFMENIAIAADNAAGIESGAFDGVKDLITVLGDIAGLTVGSTLSDIFTLGGTSMERFESDSVAFFDAMKSIGEKVDGVSIDQAKFDSIIDAAQSLSDLQSSLEPLGGVMAFFSGRTDLCTFGENASEFIGSMKTTLESLNGTNPFNMMAFDAILAAAQSLSDLQSSLEPLGGFMAWINGRTDLGTFGDKASDFIESMKTALASLQDCVSFNMMAFNDILSAATTMGAFQSSLEPFGGVISWFTGRNDLKTFGNKASDFIESMKMTLASLTDCVPFNMLAFESIMSAATTMGTFQSSLEPFGGVISWFTGRDDLKTFGNKAADFIESMKTALASLQDCVPFNMLAFDAIVSAANSLADFQSSLEPFGGVISWFTGRDDLKTFGNRAADFIGSMKTALESLNECGVFNTAALDSIIAAATSLADFQEYLEPVGGVIDWFTGRDDLGTFGEDIGLFADAMAELKTGMGEDGISEAVVASVTNAGNAIIALQQALPEEGWFDGKMNLSEFSDYVTDFGDAMSEFSAKSSEIDSAAVSSVISTAYRIKNLITSLVGLDTSGVDAFTGIGSGGIGADGPAYDIAKAITKFSEEVANIDTTAVSTAVTAATDLKTLMNGLVNLDTSGVDNFKPEAIGTQLQTYSDKVTGIDSSAISSSITAANSLKNFINSLTSMDTSGIVNFKIGYIGTALKNYGASISGVNLKAIASSVMSARALKDFINDLANLDASGVGSFKTAIDELSTVNIDGVVEAFSGASAKMFSAARDMMDGLLTGMQSKTSDVDSLIREILLSVNDEIGNKMQMFVRAGSTIVSKIASGITKESKSVASAVSASLTKAANGIRSYYNSFYYAGRDLGSGLVIGINSKKTSVYNAGYALGRAAVLGEKAGQASNSPSKLTIQAGEWLGEGLVIGIKHMFRSVYSAGSNLGRAATDTISESVSKIAGIFDTDLDTQPTIRPVLDLSNVRAGANTLGHMVSGMGASVGVLANVGAINSMMNGAIQNGGNSEVVSAINKLNKKMDNLSNTSYTINGITYDDGSNIAEAVKSITRAAIRERRV